MISVPGTGRLRLPRRKSTRQPSDFYSKWGLLASVISIGCLLFSVMRLRPFIYLDDIVVFSTTFEEHFEQLESVFRRLPTNNLKLKASKCEFFRREVTYLGHVVSEEVIRTDPAKLEAVSNWPEPKTVKEARMFLGFTGYYRRIVKGYASIVRSLNDLLIGQPTNKKAKTGKKPKLKPSECV